MNQFSGSRLGRRVLRLGDKGRDVKQLHELLCAQGYDLGDEEDYGYLTKYAVQQFQKEHCLVADGIAGKRFFALALGSDLPVRRRVHVVQPKETLEQIAQSYGLSPRAFRQSKRIGHLFPGKQLLFYEREVWGICPPDGLAQHPPAQLTGLVYRDPCPAGSGVTSVREVGLNSENGWEEIHENLRTSCKRRVLATKMAQSAASMNGLYLPWQHIVQLDGARYLRFLRRLRRLLSPNQLLWIDLGTKIPQRKVWGGLNYSAVNELVDRIVLTLSAPAISGSYLEPGFTENLLNFLGNQIHPWKILLKIPVYALEWEGDDADSNHENSLRLPYSKALARAYRHGARLEQSSSGTFFRYQSKGKQIYLRLPSFSGFDELLNIVNQRNLAGVILNRLEMEDPRIWSLLPSHFRLSLL